MQTRNVLALAIAVINGIAGPLSAFDIKRAREVRRDVRDLREHMARAETLGNFSIEASCRRMNKTVMDRRPIMVPVKASRRFLWSRVAARPERC